MLGPGPEPEKPKIPAELPELAVLIPSVIGAVYSYQGSTYLAPERIEDASKSPDHGLVRCGFKLYEIREWHAHQRAWKVRQFSATLTERELGWLADGVK